MFEGYYERVRASFKHPEKCLKSAPTATKAGLPGRNLENVNAIRNITSPRRDESNLILEDMTSYVGTDLSASEVRISQPWYPVTLIYTIVKD